MDQGQKTKAYMVSVLVAGAAILAVAFSKVPLEQVNFYFLVLFCLTIGIGSRITVQIPQLKSHIAVSDTFVFLALLIFGGELAIILASIEATFSSWRFCSKKITVFFNAASAAISTTAVIITLSLLGLNTEAQLHGYRGNTQDFVIALSVMALVQFVVNTGLAAIYDSINESLSFWNTWKRKYLWAFITFLVGSVSAGIMVQLADNIGFGVIIAAFPVILLLYFTYRMYIATVDMSIKQAEQAEQYASVLEERSVALRESEQRFRSAFTHAPIGIALVSKTGQWIKVNRALSDILGYEEEELLRTDFQTITFEEDVETAAQMVKEVLEGIAPSCQLEKRYVHKSGITVWASVSVSATGNSKTENADLVFQIQDISEKKLAEQKLQYEATHDALTGLPNRAFFMSRLFDALEARQANAEHKVSILFIDLDRFKNVNDSLGHVFGDKLLVALSDRLRTCLRPSDIIARLGGDEFTVLVEGMYAPEEVSGIAERVQRELKKPFDIERTEIYSSASIGILNATDHHQTPEDMMRDADTAMYQAKRSGRARHEIFDEKMHLAAKEILQLEVDLRKAIENRDFIVKYQPIFSLESGEMEGIEALARWYHPVHGNVSPSRFIPLAEEIGLIDEFSEHILRTACEEIRGIKAVFAPGSTTRLCVNLSSHQFASGRLVKRITQTLNETNFPASRLKLEITESVFFAYQDQAIEMLHDLRARGIDIDIDDFGTGYSNLGYLVRLPISSLKIDRSFVNMIGRDGTDTEIVKTIIAMARNLNLRVVAEGIENEPQLSVLRHLGCESGQGHLFAAAMSADILKDFLESEMRRPILAAPLHDISIRSSIQ
jgi:diguanylate cyclase (GGDEF)-like protein/PAS domain S-box-containing protein